MLEYACKKECKLFYQHVEDFKLKLGVLEYADNVVNSLNFTSQA
jgi:hypothetical protein